MIDVIVQDEHGTKEARFADVQIVGLIRNNASRDSKCLAFIDPYGDTIFNRRQAEVLAAEIEAASAGMSDIERERAAALRLFVRRVADGIHLYLKFVGD